MSFSRILFWVRVRFNDVMAGDEKQTPSQSHTEYGKSDVRNTSSHLYLIALPYTLNVSIQTNFVRESVRASVCHDTHAITAMADDPSIYPSTISEPSTLNP